MTNPYEDLFKGSDQPSKAPASAPNPALERLDPTDALEAPQSQRRAGWILLAVYVAGLILVQVAMVLLFGSAYPDAQAIVDNIVDVDVAYVMADSTLYPDYPYEISVTGRFENHNESAVGSITADFSFLGVDGALVASTSYAADDVAAGDALVINDVFYVDAPVTSITYEWSIDMSSSFYIAMNAIHAFTLAGLFLAIDRRQFRARFRQLIADWKLALGQIVTGALLLYGANLASALLLEALGVSMQSQNEATIATMFQPDPLRLVILFLTLCVFTPIVEETVFRRALFSFFPERLGPFPPILVSGAIFGLMHVLSYGDFIQSIPYIAMGLVFGYLYWSSHRNIYVTIGVHFINNLISFVLYVIALYGIAA